VEGFDLLAVLTRQDEIKEEIAFDLFVCNETLLWESDLGDDAVAPGNHV
jgi:hypothetical protein